MMWALAAVLAVAASPLPLRITYLANEGVLVGGPCTITVIPRLAFERDRWKPKHVVAFHIGADDDGSVPRLRAAMPAAWICTQQGESRTY